MGADSFAENIPQMSQNLSAQFVCLRPKVLDFNEKRLHWTSVVRSKKFEENPTDFFFKFQDVFVVDPFEGVGFEHLMRYKCTIVGPRCLLTCLQKGEPVPDLPYPMYTASFR